MATKPQRFMTELEDPRRGTENESFCWRRSRSKRSSQQGSICNQMLQRIHDKDRKEFVGSDQFEATVLLFLPTEAVERERLMQPVFSEVKS